MNTSFFQRVRHHLSRLRLQPIPVFVFHQVSDEFAPEPLWDCDWTQTDVFKRNILALKKRYEFISLSEVQRHLAKDRFRLKKYAALTADDGWASMKNILPWLVEQKIPVTLFLNPSCLDGIHKNSRETDKLLTEEEVIRIVNEGFPYISVASHGWTHGNCAKMKMDEFVDSVERSEQVLVKIPNKVAFFAFASGLYNEKLVTCLRGRKLIPVFVDSIDNEDDPLSIHRYGIDGRMF